jgi:glycosyltransferase involved in cell wall biosynthesis
LVATVTPISDNAGAFSVPEIGVPNPTPLCLDYDGVGRLVAQHSKCLRPRTPVGNGFCLYIKRAVIDEIGYFDAEAFPRGYGEENDFCMRALGRGWHHVVDDRVFVHHVREASFGAAKQELIDQGRAVVDQRHPQHTGLIREFVRSEDMAAVRAAVESAYEGVSPRYEQSDALRPRILFVAHEGGGGTPATNLDLMAGLEQEYDCLLLTSTGRELRLDRMVAGQRAEVERRKLDLPISPLDFSRQDYRAAVTEMLDCHAIELIHVRHLFKHTLDLPSVAATRCIPVVFSFHDFYFTCPTVHLLDDKLRYCGAECTPGDGSCRIPSEMLEGLPPLKHRFVYEWREEVQRTLLGVDAFVTTSPHARLVHVKALPALKDRRFEIIEHGRDLAAHSIAEPPETGGPVRIAVPTNLDVHKGAELMRSILDHDSSGRIQFHLFGEVPAQYVNLGRDHGEYERDELPQQLAMVRPAFVGIFSIWAETYSHILSEAWAAGVPVVATNLGAPRERIERHGGGWLIDPHDPAQAVHTILSVADDPAEYGRGRASATLHNVRTVAQMASDYSLLYRQVLDARRIFVPRHKTPTTQHL